MDWEEKEMDAKHIEEAISYMGAKVAEALELLNQAKVLSANSELLLIRVQEELEELYVSLDQE